MKKSKNIERKQKNKEVENDKNWEVRQNLLGLFSLLFEVDRRVSPYLYKHKKYNLI
jgi:hypothetical protein